MCIDVVGVHYLERIHQFGRRMTTADYLNLLKEAKLRRKRKETMRRHYETLLMVMRMKVRGIGLIYLDFFNAAAPKIIKQ